MHLVNRRVVFALVAVLGLAACKDDATRPARHVVVLGLGAGNWDVLDPLITRGLLPSLAWLRDHGAVAPLGASDAHVAPVIWTSIATGKHAQKHGIESFVKSSHVGEAPTAVTRAQWRAKAFWNILGDGGFDVAIIGWPVTWPAEGVNGRMITDRAHLGALDERNVFPAGYLSAVAIPSADEAKRAIPGIGASDRLVRAWRRDAYYLRAAERVLDDGTLPRVFALELRGPPIPEPTSIEAAVPEDVIARYCKWTDGAVGRILDYYVDSSRLVIVLVSSPRGAGVFISQGPGVPAATRLAHVAVEDVAPTLLYYLGVPAGADMDGIVPDGLFIGTAAVAEPTKIPSYEEPSVASVPTDMSPSARASDEKLFEDLRSFGYLD